MRKRIIGVFLRTSQLAPCLMSIPNDIAVGTARMRSHMSWHGGTCTTLRCEHPLRSGSSLGTT